MKSILILHMMIFFIIIILWQVIANKPSNKSNHNTPKLFLFKKKKHLFFFLFLLNLVQENNKQMQFWECNGLNFNHKIIKQNVSENKAQPEKNVEEERRLKIYTRSNAILWWAKFISGVLNLALRRILIDREFRWWERTITKYYLNENWHQSKSKWDFRMLSESYKLFSSKYSLFFNSGSWKVYFFSSWRTHTHTHKFTRLFVSVKLPQDQQVTQSFLSFRYSCASEIVLHGEQKHLFVALKLNYASIHCMDLLRYMYSDPCMCV